MLSIVNNTLPKVMYKNVNVLLVLYYIWMFPFFTYTQHRKSVYKEYLSSQCY